VLDAGVSSAGIPYLVMELLEGRTLGQRLQAEGAVPATIAVPLVSAVASAVAAAHASGIVHRDIKPENVFLHGSDAVPKLLDFGIARLLDDTEDGDRETLTATGQVVGTPAYMAPERLRGAAYDERSDVYSLGVVLYEALTGVHPFERRGGTPWENVRLRANRAVPPLRMGLPAVPPDLEDIVTRALALDPAGRPSAREMATALAAIDPEPLATLARPTSAPRVASATTMDVEE
jgi:serine/threonine protein kinase